jgi:hypothetical protein
MAEMNEILPVRQNPGEPLRRWFHSAEMELIDGFLEHLQDGLKIIRSIRVETAN